MVELLAAGLTGSAFSHEATSFFEADSPAPRVGQTLILINPGGQTDYASRVSELLQLIAGMEGARLPGMRREASLKSAETDGLNVPSALLAQARQLAGLA
jgi:(2R)-3-sulfolactate dehydrogenase (NADP+)